MTIRTVNGETVRLRREERYRSRSAFCRAAGISLAQMKRIESGACQPYPNTARSIARALGCTLAALRKPYVPATDVDDEVAA